MNTYRMTWPDGDIATEFRTIKAADGKWWIEIGGSANDYLRDASYRTEASALAAVKAGYAGLDLTCELIEDSPKDWVVLYGRREAGGVVGAYSIAGPYVLTDANVFADRLKLRDWDARVTQLTVLIPHNLPEATLSSL